MLLNELRIYTCNTLNDGHKTARMICDNCINEKVIRELDLYMPETARIIRHGENSPECFICGVKTPDSLFDMDDLAALAMLPGNEKINIQLILNPNNDTYQPNDPDHPYNVMSRFLGKHIDKLSIMRWTLWDKLGINRNQSMADKNNNKLTTEFLEKKETDKAEKLLSTIGSMDITKLFKNKKLMKQLKSLDLKKVK